MELHDLVAAGADPRLMTREKTTALMMVTGLGRTPDPGATRMTESAAIEAAKLALEFGDDINAANDNGDTALHAAVSARASHEIVKALVERGAKLDGLTLQITQKAGPDGRLFGSVTNLDLERLLAERGFQVDRRRIELDETIKHLGTYPVVVHVGRDVRATIQVTVEPVEAE